MNIESVQGRNEGTTERRAITSAVIKVGNELAVCKNDSRRFWQLRDGESAKGASSYEFLLVSLRVAIQVVSSGANEFTIDTLIAIERVISRGGKG